LNVDVVLLQEVWHPAGDIFNIWLYTKPIVKLRQGSEGGGVAIVTHRKVEVVHLLEYEVDGLEAVWADVMLGKVGAVVGSVYVPSGDINAINILDTVIGKILQSHSKLLIAMDANARNALWDYTCIGIPHSRKSLSMGTRLEEIMDKYGLQIHNTGVPTYRSGNVTTAPDVTFSVGITQYGNVSWSVIDDYLRTPHEGLLIDVGKSAKFERREVINWRSFDWKAYREETKS